MEIRRTRVVDSPAGTSGKAFSQIFSVAAAVEVGAAVEMALAMEIISLHNVSVENTTRRIFHFITVERMFRDDVINNLCLGTRRASVEERIM